MSRRRLDCNILVISDLHLGEDLRPGAKEVSYLRRVVTIERELEAFLAHHAHSRIDGRPWRLVVNGDMVDFMAVMILPGSQPEETVPSEDELRFGLGYAERQTVVKLDRVIERHTGVFKRLAEFVAAGNELVVVVGNHDVEFHYPAVQRRFVEHLRTLAPVRPERIRFCPWFYYEEELVYVEHGHQYDEYCSFDYQLHPVEHTGHVAMSISHAGLRYFANQVPSLDTSVGEIWGLVDYFRWGWGMGARRFAQVFYVYGAMIWKIVELWSRLSDRRYDEARRRQHRAELERLAAEYRIAVEKMEALDGLRSLPAPRRLFKIFRAFFVDRLAVGLLGFLGLLLTLTLPAGWAKLYGAAAVAAGTAALNYALSRGRFIPSPEALRRAPEFIGRILRAPFIVFGHSHRPEAIPLPGGATYFNTGTWAESDDRYNFTHLIITGEEPRAELRQWRDGASAPFPLQRA